MIKIYKDIKNTYITDGIYHIDLDSRQRSEGYQLLFSEPLNSLILYETIIDGKICIGDYIIDLKKGKIRKGSLPTKNITLKVVEDKENRLRFYEGRDGSILISENGGTSGYFIKGCLVFRKGKYNYGFSKNWSNDFFMEVDSVSFKGIVIGSKVYIKGSHYKDCIIDLKNNTVKVGKLPKRKITLKL